MPTRVPLERGEHHEHGGKGYGPSNGGPQGRDDGDADDGGTGGAGGAEATSNGATPDYCAKVPLPPSTAVQACVDALKSDATVASDMAAVITAFHACVKDAFTAAMQTLCAQKDAACQNTNASAACTSISELCASGLTDSP